MRQVQVLRARGPPVAQLGCQGHFAARPADQLCLRDSTRSGNIRFANDRVAWLLCADSPALGLPNCGPCFSNTVQPGNHPPSPLWQTPDSGHGLGLDHEFAENGQGTRYTERPLTDQAHIKEPLGLSGSDKVLDHLHLDRWIGHRKNSGCLSPRLNEDSFRQSY